MLLLLLPLFLRFVFRVKFVRAILKSLIAVALGLAVVFCVYAGIRTGMRRFSPDKWREHPALRYLMLDDLRERYALTGISKEEAFSLLGTGDGQRPAGCYFVRDLFLSEEDFCLEWDENGVVTDTYIRYID